MLETVPSWLNSCRIGSKNKTGVFSGYGFSSTPNLKYLGDPGRVFVYDFWVPSPWSWWIGVDGHGVDRLVCV